MTIGNNVTITGVKILTHDASTFKELGYTKLGRVSIGNDCFIGWGSIILPGTNIGNKVIVGAGAVVAKDIPDNSVAVGNPARVICTYDEYMERQKAKMEKYPTFESLSEDSGVFDRTSDHDREELIKAGYGFVK